MAGRGWVDDEDSRRTEKKLRVRKSGGGQEARGEGRGTSEIRVLGFSGRRNRRELRSWAMGCSFLGLLITTI